MATCQSGESFDSVLDGFAITNGKVNGVGGGMYNYMSNPTVTNCTFSGDWYLQFPILVQLALGSIPVPDGVYILPFTFPPDTPTPLSLTFQAGIGPELTNLCVLEVE